MYIKPLSFLKNIINFKKVFYVVVTILFIIV